MSDDEAAFLRTIRENPDADLPRLVYADYLEEQGHQLRAEFLRAHIELESLKEDSPRRRELAFWCYTQLDTQSHLLFETPLQPKFARHGRGLIEAAEFWNASDGEIASAFHLAPLRRIWVYGLDRWLSQLKRVPVENCLHTLDLTGNRLTADALRYLGTVMRFPHLKELVLTGCDLDDEAVGVLWRMPFRELERIHLWGNPLSRDARNRLRDHFGKRLVMWGNRDPERLYPFHQDGDITVGVTNELTQLFLWLGGPGLLVARFDYAGNLIATESHEGDDDDELDAIRDELMDAAVFRPATIRVKRFGFEDGQGIGDFPTDLMWRLEAPSDRNPQEDAEEWDVWLSDGNFTWALGDDHGEWWLNADGEVTET